MARHTRRAIIDAAHQFLTDGFAATTMPAVAAYAVADFVTSG